MAVLLEWGTPGVEREYLGYAQAGRCRNLGLVVETWGAVTSVWMRHQGGGGVVWREWNEEDGAAF